MNQTEQAKQISEESQRFDLAVLIGRFQPFHEGHATLLRRALACAPEVVIVLGSAFHARSTKNPFTWQERDAMIRTCLSEADAARVKTIPVRDYYDDKRWSASVQNKVKQFLPEARTIALVGYFKDASSYYLNRFPHWTLEAVEAEHAIDATTLRSIFFETENIEVSLAVLAQQVPSTVRQYLKAWSHFPHFAVLAHEHLQLQKYKAAWQVCPYPPIFSTVDAVVVTAGHALLVQRGGFPGKGLWALPGGFVDQDERLLHAALRELREETKLAVLQSSLENALIDVQVFDHPYRSLRGRTITHAHYFDLRSEHFPDIEAADDAAAAKWVAIDELGAMEEQFFDDHFHILDHFLKLTAEP